MPWFSEMAFDMVNDLLTSLLLQKLNFDFHLMMVLLLTGNMVITRVKCWSITGLRSS